MAFLAWIPAVGIARPRAYLVNAFGKEGFGKDGFGKDGVGKDGVGKGTASAVPLTITDDPGFSP
jgi:hypothetical protein